MIYANAFVSIALLAAICVFLYGPWQSTCTDLARQYCFKRRDRLFDLARAGRISFSSPEYRTMRSSIEQAIRYCHDLSWIRLLIFGFDRSHYKHPESIHVSGLSRAAERIQDKELRAELEEIACEVETVLLLTAFLKSPFLWLAVPVLILLLLLVLCLDFAKDGMRALARRIGERFQLLAENA